MICLNYVYTGCMMKIHNGRWVGSSCLFIGGRKHTYVGFLFIGGRKPTYIGFILESIRKGHLIPGVVVFSIRCSPIFHSKYFSLKKPFFLGHSTRRLYIYKRARCLLLMGVIVIYIYIQKAFFCETFLYTQKENKTNPFYIRSI